ncbi:MAG: hypothetical protein HRT44_08635 [Bdellovibrionales bacterium]|nr:hypothetical protein [Bdellovibrionales bacterium]
MKASELETLTGVIFSKNSLNDLSKRFPQQKMNVAELRMMTRLENTEMDQQYDRLPSCFVSSGDWRSYRLEPDDYKAQLEKFKNGTLKADIWNGTRNCFKVGVSVDIEVNGVQEDLGKLYPTKLFLKHYTEITEEQAQLMGEKLSDLKERLSKDTEFGGFTTMVAYDYAPPETPEEKD